MTWAHYLFGFSGRINRLRYWQFSLLSGLYFLAMGVIAVPYMIIGHRDSMTVGEDLSPFGVITMICVFAIVVALFVSIFAIYVKRLHDRNKSAWWLVPFVILPLLLDMITAPHKGTTLPPLLALPVSLVAFGLSIWALIEVGFLRGTNGPNRFGRDPLAAQD